MTKIFESKTINLFDITGLMCAWKGCTCTTSFDKLPPGWVNLVVYRCDAPHVDAKKSKPGKTVFAIHDEEWIRDAVLCDQHAMELELKLVTIGRAFDSPTAGSA